MIQPLAGLSGRAQRSAAAGPARRGARARRPWRSSWTGAAEPVSEALGRDGIACWAGDFYAVRPLTAMGIDLDKGVLRMSAAHYTSADEVARLIAALERVL